MRNKIFTGTILLFMLLHWGCNSQRHRVSLDSMVERFDTLGGSILQVYDDGGELVLFTGVGVDSLPNEQRLFEIDIKKGVMDGEMRGMDFNGNVLLKGKLVNGMKEGPYIEYYDNGQVSRETVYVNDVLHGPLKVYFSDGTLQIEGAYYEGERDGKWVWYDEQGNEKDTEDNVAFRSEIVTCPCCQVKFNNRYGWTAKPPHMNEQWRTIYPKQEKGGKFHSRQCAIDCE